MGAEVVLPKSCKGSRYSSPVGTKIYIDGIEIKEVISFGVPQVGTNGLLELSITVPLSMISYAEE